MVIAGWYQDPSDPNQHRYWDGTQWTEAVQAPPPAGPQDQPPIAYSQQGFAAFAAGDVADPGADKPIGPGFGDWANSTFVGFFKAIVPVVGLVVLCTLPIWIAVYALAYSVVDGLVLRDDASGDLSLDGFEVGPDLIGLGVLFLVALVLQQVAVIGAHHYMYRTHMNLERSFFGSLSAGLKAFPKYFLVGLCLFVLMVAVVGGMFGLAVVSNGNGAAIAAIVLLGIGLVLASIYIGVRLVYIPLTASAAPEGQGFVAAAWDASRGRFWPIVGRWILVYLVAWVVGSIGNTFAQLLLGSMLPFEVSGVEIVLENGTAADVVEGISLIDYLPTVASMSLFLVFTAAIQASQSGLFASNTAAMYVQDQDPAKLRH